MKIKLKNTPEQIELVKAMASRDNSVAREARKLLQLLLALQLAKY